MNLLEFNNGATKDFATPACRRYMTMMGWDNPLMFLFMCLIIGKAFGQITQPAECGSSLGCFHDCADHGTGCTFLVTWVDAGDGSVDFVIEATAKTLSEEYFAIGFSSDTTMGSDSVTECVVENTTPPITVGVYHSYNVASGTKDSNRLTGQFATMGLELNETSHITETFMCRFKQEKSPVNASAEIFDLAQNWTLFFAQGKMDTNNPGKKLKHDVVAYTDQAVDFQGTHNDIRWSLPGMIKTPVECGTTLGCFHDGKRVTDNTYLVTWNDAGSGSIEFRIYAKAFGTSARWFAVAFSDDRIMASDSVTECILGGDGSINVYQSFNEDDEPENERLEGTDASLGLVLRNTYHNNGVFMCQFDRENHPANAPHAIFNLNSDWYLQFADGPMDGSEKEIHSLNPEPWTSSRRVDLQSFDDVIGLVEDDQPIKKLHGIIMVLAWVTCASIGLVIARYYKPMCPGKKMFGTNVWFQVHRILMIVCAVFTMTSFIIIVVLKKRFIEIEYGNAFVQGHPVCGLLVFILVLINPIMSFFRCAPDNDKRKIFNWGHLGVGVVSHILAAFTILMGINLETVHVNSATTYIVVIYVLYQIGFHIFLELRHKLFKGEAEGYDMQKMGDGTGSPEAAGETQVEKVTRLSLYVHIGVISVLSLVIVILIAVKP